MFLKCRVELDVSQRSKIPLQSTCMCLWAFPHQEDSWGHRVKNFTHLSWNSGQTYFSRGYVYSAAKSPLTTLPPPTKACSGILKEAQVILSRFRNLELRRPSLFSEVFEKLETWFWITVLAYIIYLERHLGLYLTYFCKIISSRKWGKNANLHKPVVIIYYFSRSYNQYV